MVLPIARYKKEITNLVEKNSVTIIVAETGAGKSTQVPQYLMEAGHRLVVTQPRRLAARTVSQRVAEERGEELGGTVGYRTAHDRVDSQKTRCLFCTDGLALVRELSAANNRGILVIDEVHEWNENIEVLVAWAKLQVTQQNDFKLVLMSATMESHELSEYFDNAPVIHVPGKMFPVEEKAPEGPIEYSIETLVKQGRNVLCFLPGKGEIREMERSLKQMDLIAEILPLHGELTPEAQKKCFRSYKIPKVVLSTNVAQTSVTIDDIDAVVDSGMERRIELVKGVEGLYLGAISLADSTQRKGRAGRTRPGVYIDHCPATNRHEFPVAEIQRKRLDQAVLRLAIAGLDMEQMDFFHQPDRGEIHTAVESLLKLGCLTPTRTPTPRGRQVNKLPVSVPIACAVLEAGKRGVTKDVLTIAAIMSVGGIVLPPPTRRYPENPDWRSLVSESDSDLLAQLQVWKIAEGLQSSAMSAKGISPRAFFLAKETRRLLEKAVEKFQDVSATGSREDILKSILAGMVDHLYVRKYGEYYNGADVGRTISNRSITHGDTMVVGFPRDFGITTRYGARTMRVIELVSSVRITWAIEIAPHVFEQRVASRPTYIQNMDRTVIETQWYYAGTRMQTTFKDAEASEEATQAILNALRSTGISPNSGPERIAAHYEVLAANQRRTYDGEVTIAELLEFYSDRLKGVTSLAAVEPESLQFPKKALDLSGLFGGNVRKN